MKVIFVHGRAQGELTQEELREIWLDTWKKGLEKSGLSLPPDEIIKVPFYGKKLDELVEETKKKKKKKPEEVTRSGNDGYDPAKELDFAKAFLGEIAMRSAGSNIGERDQVRSMMDNERGPLNWEFVQDILEFLDRKKIVGKRLMKLVVKDVFFYLNDSEIKKEINQIVKDCFDDEPCVVVGHSLGSIITYLILKNNPNYKVKQFITIGSPLGMQILSGLLEPPLEMPSCIQGDDAEKWYNAYDEKDYIALHPLDDRHFNIRPRIVNSNHVQNHTDNHHGILGYLDDEVIAKKIYDAMEL